jgi:plastocyanin
MRAALLAAAAVLAVVVGCGGSGGGASQPAGSVKVDMTEFKFDPSSLSVKPGRTTFFLVNSGTVAHDLVISGPSGGRVAASELVQPGGSSVFTVDNLAAGSYRVVCDQPGHESSGMRGTLSVG